MTHRVLDMGHNPTMAGMPSEWITGPKHRPELMVGLYPIWKRKPADYRVCEWIDLAIDWQTERNHEIGA